MMKTVFRSLLGLLCAVSSTVPGFAGTLTRITWASHNGTYINDTIVNGTTSPLAFTATNNLAQSFLNAADSTISLTYGSYYAISFRTYGSHTGAGTVSFVLDGVTTYSQDVTFPDPTVASDVFASFTLPGGDTVTISGTGLAADRIRVVADGAGLIADGTPDAFYLFNYTWAADVAAPKMTIAPAAAGLATIAWTPATPGFRLQENSSLSSALWINSLSNETNPVVVPLNQTNQFFRLIRP
jgi:hypothetical protein